MQYVFLNIVYYSELRMIKSKNTFKQPIIKPIKYFTNKAFKCIFSLIEGNCLLIALWILTQWEHEESQSVNEM